jgi:KDO2-lipid IV(A) lauroyltransferase
MPKDLTRLSFVERTGYYIANLFIQALLASTRLLTYDRRIPLMGWLSSRVFGPIAGFRTRVRENLQLTCPDLSSQEVKRLCIDVPDNAGRAIMEHFSPEEFAARQIHAPVEGPGLADFDEAVTAGRPVMLITGHFGNYLAGRTALQARAEKPVGALYRRMANPYFNDAYVEAFRQNGEPMFEQGRRGMMEMVRSLREGGIIAIVSDLHVYGGAVLRFFGQPAATSVLNAELALKTNAVVLPCYAIRQPDGLSFRVLVNAPIPHTDPETMTQALNDDLEAVVRAHMSQWFWIHRRWKAAKKKAARR